MIGTLLNVATILMGSFLGLLLRRGMKPAISDTVMQGLALCTMLIGFQGALQTENMLLVILSMVVGGATGALLDIGGKMERLGEYVQRKLARGADQSQGGNVAQGFVTASLVFCVGAMAVVGALDSGIRGDHSTLIAKSVLDGVAAVVFASAMGPGVMLAALPVLLYQGGISLLGGLIAPLLSARAVLEMSAVGGLLIVGIGINMLFRKDLKVANLLPAIFVPFVYFPIVKLLGIAV